MLIDIFISEKASQLVMELATAGNVYFDAKKPWVLVKDPTQRASWKQL